MSELIPNYEDLLRLEPEQLAGVLLEVLIELYGGDRQYLNRHNFLNQPDILRGYPVSHGGEILQAILEAWMWLEREGFLTPRIGDAYGMWVEISRRGRRAAGRDGIDAYRHAALLPKAHLHPKIVASAGGPPNVVFVGWGFSRHCREQSAARGEIPTTPPYAKPA